MFQRSLNNMKSLGCDSEQMPEFPVPRHSKPVVFPAINAPARSTQVSHSFQAIIDQLVQQHLTEITELSQLRISNEDRGFRPRHDSKPSLPLLYKCSVYATLCSAMLYMLCQHTDCTTMHWTSLVPGLETHSWYLLRVPDSELKLRPSQHVADFPLSITRFTIPLRNWRECKTILEFTRPKRVAINLRFGKQD